MTDTARPDTSSDRAGDSDPATPYRYTASLAADIEARWQDRWETEGTFEAPNPTGPLGDPEKVAARPKMYVLDMFPYPSGIGLHVGHPLGYIATDVYARYQRMTGHNVLHAMGFDAFGLPAEQYAVQTGTHPRVTTEANIVNMRRQLRRLGLAHDPRRSVATTDVDFYKWTQWIFLQIFNSWYDERGGPGPADRRAGGGASPSGERRPARRPRVERPGRRCSSAQSSTPTGWPTCPRRRSTGAPAWARCWPTRRSPPTAAATAGNFPVFKRNLRQWMMRITAYADRLLDDLDGLDWPEPIKLMQRNWIGRSDGRTGRRSRARPGRSRSSPPGPTPCSARPTWCWHPSTRWSTR